MRQWRRIIALGLSAPLLAHAVAVYKWTDAQGVVHYSDQPVPGAEKILTGTSPAGTTPAPAGTDAAPAPAPKPAKTLGYTSFTIESPTSGETFTGAPVVVQLRLQPALQPTHALTWVLDGTPLDQGPDAVAFSLDNVPRGSHTLTATITDPDNADLTVSTSVAFNVQRPSLLMPQHRRP